jgi:hypothetical protein
MLAAPWVVTLGVALILGVIFVNCARWKANIDGIWVHALGVGVWVVLLFSTACCALWTFVVRRLLEGSGSLAAVLLVALLAACTYAIVPLVKSAYQAYGADLPAPTLLVLTAHPFFPILAFLGIGAAAMGGRAGTGLIAISGLASAMLPLVVLALSLAGITCSCGCGSI